MRSKTWMMTLAILSRLTVAESVGPLQRRPYLGAAAAAAGVDRNDIDPDAEIDNAYNMIKGGGRGGGRNHHLPKHFQSSIPAKDMSAAEVEYVVNDESEPRQRYHGNRFHQGQRLQPMDEKEEEEEVEEERKGTIMNKYQQHLLMNKGHVMKQTSSNADQHHQHQNPLRLSHDHRHDEPEPEEIEPERPASFSQTAPYVNIRSNIDSIRPISAAVAMQESLNEESNEDGPEIVNLIAQLHPAEQSAPEVVSLISGGQKNDEVEDKEKNSLMKAEVEAALRQTQLRSGNDVESAPLTEVYLLAVVAGCSVAGFMGLILAGVCYYRLRKKVKAASDVEYPAYGVTGPTKERDATGGPAGDRKLAQSAQMYHYQHQKQQMIASERLNSDVNHRGGSDVESEEENEEGDYTVFECPGLATNGDMEVRNPLFTEQTPVTASSEMPSLQPKK